MHNALSPDKMTYKDRIKEVAFILSTAIQRLKNKDKKVSFPLDFAAQESVHGTHINKVEKQYAK